MPRRLAVLGCPAPRSWLSPSANGFDCAHCSREVVDLSRLDEAAAQRVLDTRDRAGRGPCVAYRARGQGQVALRTGLATFSVTYLAGCAPWAEEAFADPEPPGPDEVCSVESSHYDPAQCKGPPEQHEIAVVEEVPTPDKACDGPVEAPAFEARFEKYAAPGRAGPNGEAAATSSIVGYVEDLFDETPIQGARVYLESDALKKPVEAKTNARGIFEIEPVPEGHYRISVSTSWGRGIREIDLPAETRAQLAFKLEGEQWWMGMMEEID